MKPLEVIPLPVFAHRHRVNRSVRAAAKVNHRRRGDADFRNHLPAIASVGRCFSSFEQMGMPEQASGIGVECVKAGMLGGDVEHVAPAAPENFDSVNIERLGIHLAVNMKDRKSTRLNSSHMSISYAVFCLKKKKKYSRLCSLDVMSHI